MLKNRIFFNADELGRKPVQTMQNFWRYMVQMVYGTERDIKTQYIVVYYGTIMFIESKVY